MENFLGSRKYWQVISDGIAKPTIGTIIKKMHKNRDQREVIEGFEGRDRPF
jgi:hypothetical protein